jgi:type I restriction enzyme S subunit
MSRIDARPDDLKTVRDILRKHVPTRRVIAFGSRTTGRSKPFSDLDLAIMGEVTVSSAILAALAEDFDESSLPFKVDLVDWATTSQSFREIITRDAVTLQEGSPSSGAS